MTLLPLDVARQRILAELPMVSETDSLDLLAAAGHVLAEHLVAAAALPRFTQSAMDGFAVQSAVARANHALPVVGRIIAGDAAAPFPATGAVRIFTGAPLPEGFDAVVMQEHCRVVGDRVEIDENPQPGAHVRQAGEDIAAGDAILTAGTVLGAREIATAAALGLDRLVVRRMLRVGLLSTGNELVPPGADTPPGHIHDSNRPMLAALLQARRYDLRSFDQAPDDAAALARVITGAAADRDILITTGGVSVGEEDRLAEAIVRAGGTVERFKLAIRPGKPLALGRVGDLVVLGLPGNALSSFISFLLVGRDCLAHMAGAEPTPLLRLPAVAAFPLSDKRQRVDYIPVRMEGWDDRGRIKVSRLGPAGSARLKPLLLADGLAEVPIEGDTIQFIPFATILGA